MTDYWNYYNDSIYSETSNGQGSSKLPLAWKIAPQSILDGSKSGEEAKCPKIADTFIAFAITNVINSILGLILGCRPILHKISRGHLGKRNKKNTIMYNWIPPLALHIISNAIVAGIIHSSPGYGNVKVVDAMMIYFVRPRISVLILATFTALFPTHDDYPWMYALLANTIAELALQAIADIWVIVTGVSSWNTAALGIAVAMCISTGLFFIIVIIIVIASRPYDATGGDVFNREFAAGMRISNSFGNRFKTWFSMMLFGVPAYLISWGFFINLITTAKSDWCPPKLTAQVAIWVLLPLMGTIFGVGMS